MNLRIKYRLINAIRKLLSEYIAGRSSFLPTDW